MFKDKKVIVVMPAYNAAKTLRQTHADVMARLGRLEEAIPHFSEALRMTPDNAEVRDNLKQALRLSGKSETALNILTEH